MDPYNVEFKKQIGEYLTNKGLISNKSKQLWLDDNNFFFTVIEISPCKFGGVYINMGINFLWYNELYIAYNYYEENGSRIYIDNVTNLVVGNYDTKLVVEHPEKMKLITDELSNLLEIYKKYRDLNLLKKALINRRDLFYYNNRNNCNSVDIELAVVYYLLSDFERSNFIINNYRPNRLYPPLTEIENPAANKVLDYTGIEDRIKTRRSAMKKQFPKIDTNKEHFFGNL